MKKTLQNTLTKIRNFRTGFKIYHSVCNQMTITDWNTFSQVKEWYNRNSPTSKSISIPARPVEDDDKSLATVGNTPKFNLKAV